MAKKLSTNGIARIDNALMLRTKICCDSISGGTGRLKSPGEVIRRKSAKKKTTSRTTPIKPSADRRRGGSSTIGISSGNFVVDLRVRWGDSSKTLPRSCFGRKMASLSKNLAEMTATVAAQSVAVKAVPTIAVGALHTERAQITI